MSTAMIFTMVLCFAFSISIAISIGGAAVLGLGALATLDELDFWHLAGAVDPLD